MKFHSELDSDPFFPVARPVKLGNVSLITYFAAFI